MFCKSVNNSKTKIKQSGEIIYERCNPTHRAYVYFLYSKFETCKLNKERNISMKKEWEYSDCEGCKHFSVECQYGICCLRLYPNKKSNNALIFLKLYVTSDTS